jgi:hypothetical protein
MGLLKAAGSLRDATCTTVEGIADEAPRTAKLAVKGLKVANRKAHRFVASWEQEEFKSYAKDLKKGKLTLNEVKADFQGDKKSWKNFKAFLENWNEEQKKKAEKSAPTVPAKPILTDEQLSKMTRKQINDYYSK